MLGLNDFDASDSKHGFSQKDLEKKYRFYSYKSENAWIGFKHYLTKYYTPSTNCMKQYVVNRFPIITLIKNYKIKKYLAKDFISGITIGVVQIPQSN
jgi:hypothetical protein